MVVNDEIYKRSRNTRKVNDQFLERKLREISKTSIIDKCELSYK